MFDHPNRLQVDPLIEGPTHSRRRVFHDPILAVIKLPQANAELFEDRKEFERYFGSPGWQDQDRAIGEVAIAGGLDQALAPVLQLGLDGGELDALLERQRTKVLALGLVTPSQPDHVGAAIAVKGEFATARKSAERIGQSGEVGLLKPGQEVGLSAFRGGCLRKVPTCVVAAKANNLGFRPNGETGNGRFHGGIVNGCHHRIASANPAKPPEKFQLEMRLGSLIASNKPVTPLNDAQLGGYFFARATTVRRIPAGRPYFLILPERVPGPLRTYPQISRMKTGFLKALICVICDGMFRCTDSFLRVFA